MSVGFRQWHHPPKSAKTGKHPYQKVDDSHEKHQGFEEAAHMANLLKKQRPTGDKDHIDTTQALELKMLIMTLRGLI
jgi:hypothetical protein